MARKIKEVLLEDYGIDVSGAIMAPWPGTNGVPLDTEADVVECSITQCLLASNLIKEEKRTGLLA